MTLTRDVFTAIGVITFFAMMYSAAIGFREVQAENAEIIREVKTISKVLEIDYGRKKRK